MNEETQLGTALQERTSRPLRSAGAWERRNPKRSLNDMVEELHLALANGNGDDTDRYLSLLEPAWPEQAVEGTLNADNISAAMMLRQLAAKKNSSVQNEKLATIWRALDVVLHATGDSRRQRRTMLHGNVVRDLDGGE